MKKISIFLIIMNMIALIAVIVGSVFAIIDNDNTQILIYAGLVLMCGTHLYGCLNVCQIKNVHTQLNHVIEAQHRISIKLEDIDSRKSEIKNSSKATKRSSKE